MLEKIINKASEYLKKREETLNQLNSNSRRLRILSKQAIVLIHSKQYQKADENLSEAANHLEEIHQLEKRFPKIKGQNLIEAAEQEYAEAQIFLKILTTNGYPEPEELGISYTNYLLGLADVPGELRRRTLEYLNEGDLDKVKKIFSIMDYIYFQLTFMDESHLLKGLRRKLDIIRSIIERTQAEITTETRRQKLINELQKLESKI